MVAGVATIHEDPRLLRRQAVSAVLLAATAGALVSMATFNPYDLPENQYPPNSPLANWCGKAGARLAGWLLQWFGTAAFVAVLTAGVWGIGMFFAGRLREPWMKLSGAAFLLGASCSAAAMFAPVNTFTSSNGGAIGLYLADLLRLYFGPMGAWLIIGLMGFFGLLFLVAMIPAFDFTLDVTGTEILGFAYLGTGMARLISIVVDESRDGSNIISLVWEIGRTLAFRRGRSAAGKQDRGPKQHEKRLLHCRYVGA